MARWTTLRTLIVVSLTVMTGWTWVDPAEGQSPSDTLIVGTRQAPPFAMRNDLGEWSGITIDLWRQVAQALDWEYEFRELPLEGFIDSVAAGVVDVGAAAISVTSEREEVIDFSLALHNSGLGVAVRLRQGLGSGQFIRRIISPAFLKVAAGLCLLLSLVGVGVWWFEHKRNKEQFGGSRLQGIGSGFWWAAVTMTTVGYGDKAPRTLGGRLVALVWMFAAVIVISGFTASIATSLTINAIGTDIRSTEDLANKRMGTVRESATEQMVLDDGWTIRGFDSLEEAMRAMVAGRIDAVLYDEPLLRYLARQEEFVGEVTVLPRTLYPERYAFVLRQGSPLREPINRLLLETLEDPTWESRLQFYLGRD